MHIDDDTKEIIVSFVTEGFERLDDAEARLGELGATRTALGIELEQMRGRRSTMQRNRDS